MQIRIQMLIRAQTKMLVQREKQIRIQIQATIIRDVKGAGSNDLASFFVRFLVDSEISST